MCDIMCNMSLIVSNHAVVLNVACYSTSAFVASIDVAVAYVQLVFHDASSTVRATATILATIYTLQ